MDNYNEQRKELLMAIDQGEEVTDLSLGMYDLTPYFKEDIDKSLAEKIMYINNEKRRIEHIQDKVVCFAPPQENALLKLFKYNRCILSAPTSFGKTLIIKEYIYRIKPQNIVYIVPTNALAYELENSFKNNNAFVEYEIFDRSKLSHYSNDRNDKLLFIGTQEKYLEVKKSLNQKIDLFVIDEAYKLEESTKNQRAFKLSESFLDSIVTTCNKVFLLSPNAIFKGFEKYKFQEIKSNFNPVDKVFKTIKKEDFYDEIEKKSKENKTIVYFDSPQAINSTINKFNSVTDDKNEYIDFLENEYHPEWSVVKLLKKGILVHHGQMPKYIQNKAIKLFNDNNNYNLLLGTKSISEGINTPCKNLFIDMSCNKSKMKGLLLKNTIGRAGRLGQYPIGHIYSTDDIEDIVNQEVDIYLSIAKDEELQEIEESSDETTINELCRKFHIDKEFYNKIRNDYHLSLSTISKIFLVLQEDLKNAGLSTFPFIVLKVFRDYHSFNTDKICICGILQYYYYDKNHNKYSLRTFDDRIKFYNLKSSEKKTPTEIIDYYMKFLYASLDNYFLPIANIAIELSKKYSEWKFGKNILELITTFLERYNKLIIGINDYSSFTNEQKIIVQTLKDYGIIINNSTVNREMIAEIEGRLNIRYSTYDIIRAINYLATNSKNNAKKFLYIKKNYID